MASVNDLYLESLVEKNELGNPNNLELDNFASRYMQLNNYEFLKVGDGLSVSEKIR